MSAQRPTVRRIPPVLLALVAVLALAAWTVALPQAVAACLCADDGRPADVVFTGMAADGPDRPSIFGDIFAGSPGIYTFDIRSVTRGDPHDGRVYTPAGFGGCGTVFQLGATYEVHANVVGPNDDATDDPGGATLIARQCVGRSRLLAPAEPGYVIASLATTPEVIGIGIATLIAVVAAVSWLRRRAVAARSPSAGSGQRSPTAPYTRSGIQRRRRALRMRGLPAVYPWRYPTEKKGGQDGCLISLAV